VVIRRRLLAVGLALIAATTSALPVAAREPIVVGSGPHYSPLGADDIASRARVLGFYLISPAPFRVAG
jgi:hypothetical protein